MNVLDLFSGIGGFSLGLQRAGMTTIAFCEIDPFCARVLRKHWPDVPIYDDVRTAEFPAADIVVGGFPCQDVSCAGKRAGITGERSGLYRELVRALRVVRPRHAIMENVAALLGDGLDVVLGDLAESGFDAEWDCVPAQAVGACHERDRVWIVGHGPDMPGEPMGPGGQPRLNGGMGATDTDPPRHGCGQGRPWRPPDSFARIRDEARRNAADAAGPRLEGWALSEGAWRILAEPARGSFWPWPARWPDEPALSGVDDGIPDWMDRVKATGNAVVPQIPELIGRAIMEANAPRTA
jgi:DNA (cytosine-5)-methyltransferase 1